MTLTKPMSFHANCEAKKAKTAQPKTDSRKFNNVINCCDVDLTKTTKLDVAI